MNITKIQKNQENIKFFKQCAIFGKYIQQLSLASLALNFLMYTYTNLDIFKFFIILSSIILLFSIFYLSFIIDPLWKKEITKYTKNCLK
jgi:hypothetical protein